MDSRLNNSSLSKLRNGGSSSSSGSRRSRDICTGHEVFFLVMEKIYGICRGSSDLKSAIALVVVPVVSFFFFPFVFYLLQFALVLLCLGGIGG
jgi:hypothetical protein